MSQDRIDAPSRNFLRSILKVPASRIRNANFTMKEIPAGHQIEENVKSMLEKCHRNAEKVFLRVTNVFEVLHDNDREAFQSRAYRTILAHGTPEANVFNVINERLRDMREEDGWGLSGKATYMTECGIKAANYCFPRRIFDIDPFGVEQSKKSF